jgi:hypothetical protein
MRAKIVRLEISVKKKQKPENRSQEPGVRSQNIRRKP